MDDFEGKVAVITGGGSGIGRAVARRLAVEGMRLVLADIEQSALDDACVELAELGAEVLGVRCDVSKGGDVEAVAVAAMDRFGAIHLAMNNAGVAAGGLSWELTEADWEWVLGVNLWGVIHGVRAFTPRIIASGGGHVVNTASMAGLTSTPFMSPYNVSKHGVVTLSETMFVELSLTHPEVGITVVCPGWVRTGINRSDRNRPPGDGPDGSAAPAAEGFRDVIDGLIAAGLEPDDVAAQIVDAVRARRFYVLTHADWSTLVSRRVERIVAGEDPEFTVPTND